MALETFNFPYHTVETTNPESGYRGQFGGSYIFTTPPTDPDQRQFTLHFKAMQYFTNIDGDLDPFINATYNMKALSDFYGVHKLWKSFLYNHPVHGLLECKFYKPLKEPEGLEGGFGATKEFTVELVEIP